VILSTTLNNKSGVLFYGTNGASMVPFYDGWLCMRGPIRRTAMQTSGGNPPPNDCSGAFAFDFNAHIASGVDPNLTVGAVVCCQYWSRDGGAESQNPSERCSELHDRTVSAKLVTGACAQDELRFLHEGRARRAPLLTRNRGRAGTAG
jgi:hypothetical protein